MISMVVFRKELLQLFRDPIGMVGIVLPAVFLPLFACLMYSFVIEKKKVEAVTIVKLGASEEDFKEYLDRAWHWFQSRTSSASGARDLRRFVDRVQSGGAIEADARIGSLPADSQSFHEWCKFIARIWRKNVGEMSAIQFERDGIEPELKDLFDVVVEGVGNVEFVSFDSAEDLLTASQKAMAAINSGSVDIALRCEKSPTIAADGSRTNSLEITLFHDNSNPRSVQSHERIMRLLRLCENLTTTAGWRQNSRRDAPSTMYLKHNIDVSEGAPLSRSQRNALDALSTYGSFSLFMLVLRATFGFAMEVGTTERERKTIEPLLITPASRTEIALGKYFAVALASILSACLTLVCIWCIMHLMLPPHVFPAFTLWKNLRLLSLVLVLLTTSVLSATGVSLAVSFMAGSAKHNAQMSTIALWLMLLPGLLVFPGILELGIPTSFIPIVGANLLIKNIFLGTVDWLLVGISIISSLLVAGSSLAAVIHIANRESVLYDE